MTHHKYPKDVNTSHTANKRHVTHDYACVSSPSGVHILFLLKKCALPKGSTSKKPLQSPVKRLRTGGVVICGHRPDNRQVPRLATECFHSTPGSSKAGGEEASENKQNWHSMGTSFGTSMLKAKCYVPNTQDPSIAL